MDKQQSQDSNPGLSGPRAIFPLPPAQTGTCLCLFSGDEGPPRSAAVSVVDRPVLCAL